VCVVEVIVPKDCVLLTGQLLLVGSCITPDLLERSHLLFWDGYMKLVVVHSFMYSELLELLL
jgi:hypothetical protein